MEFFTEAIDLLSKIVTLVGGGIVIMGLLHYFEANDPNAKSIGTKQLISGAGIAAVGYFLIPQLAMF